MSILDIISDSDSIRLFRRGIAVVLIASFGYFTQSVYADNSSESSLNKIYEVMEQKKCEKLKIKLGDSELVIGYKLSYIGKISGQAEERWDIDYYNGSLHYYIQHVVGTKPKLSGVTVDGKANIEKKVISNGKTEIKKIPILRPSDEELNKIFNEAASALNGNSHCVH